MKKLLILVVGLAVIACGCNIALPENGFVELPDNDVVPLPVVGSAENLKKLVDQQQSDHLVKFAAEMDLKATTDSAQDGRSHSSTNVQVQGIDEADAIKTDGTYIYLISEAKVFITRAWPATSLDIIQELELDQGFYPSTLYVDEDYLVVIGMQQDEEPKLFDEGSRRTFMPFFNQSTRVLIYDIRDKDSISFSRDVSVDGYNAHSRKKGNYLYLLNSRSAYWALDQEEPERPWYKDSASGAEKRIADFDDIRYFPNAPLHDYVIFAALDLSQGTLEMDTYLGWTQHMYMSHDNLYLATTDGTSTTIHRFAVDGLNLGYKGEGTVDGIPLNQFSMDEHNGYFRIATTDYADWQNITNKLYVLDGSMQVVGQINDIAKGEQIYSARFIGDKGYLVTFEMVDPLFVIDLANPRAPKILGELKIPGFSNYLHPLDENHLLGIGQDTQVNSSEGREFVTTKGMKLAIFDVSEVNNPKERHVELIGGQGTWSDALYNHKAVFFHEGVLALPVSVTASRPADRWDYKVEFAGALFYDVDLDTGFNQVGRVSHTNGEQEMFYHSDIRRIVQIEDVYYTVSLDQIMAHSAQDFQKLAELKLPVPDHYYPAPDFKR